MKWEAAAKLVAGPVGSIWKLTQRRRRARSVCGFAHATCGSPPFMKSSYRPQGGGYRAIENRKWKNGEDRNRTYLGPACTGSTTVLKTARATRHPSLSGLRIEEKTPNPERRTPNAELKRIRSNLGRCHLRQGLPPSLRFGVTGRRAREGPSHIHLAFLIALTMVSKSGQSPDSSLE